MDHCLGLKSRGIRLGVLVRCVHGLHGPHGLHDLRGHHDPPILRGLHVRQLCCPPLDIYHQGRRKVVLIGRRLH